MTTSMGLGSTSGRITTHCSLFSVELTDAFGFDSAQPPKSIAFQAGEARRIAEEQTLKVTGESEPTLSRRSPSGSMTVRLPVSSELGADL